MKANGVTLVAHSRQQHSLHRLLDSVEKTHRDDIDTYSKGHLNEGKLYKLQTGPGSKHKPWKSSSSKAGHLPTQSAEVERRAYSTESYLSDRDVARGDVVDAVKPSFPQTNQIRPAWAASIEDDSMAEAQLLGALKDKNLQAFQRSLPLHAGNGAITRKDHLRQMREIDRKVIGRSDQHERRAMSGMKAVEHLEKKLREGLHQLPAGNFSKPNFNRLQVFSGVFDDLIADSNTLSYLLKTVKQEYDNYLTYLLDGHLTRQRTLCDQVEDISRNGDAVSAAMDDAMRTVDGLEDTARKELQLNEKLRQQLGEEAELMNRLLSTEKVPKPPVVRPQPEVADTSDKLSSLRLKILDKMDNITELKNQLRNDYVPIGLCSDLEQCVRDTEIEIQTLMSQKDYFEKSITDLEGELKRAIEAADTTEHDAKRIWKKIQALTNSSRKAQNIAGTTSRILGNSNEGSDDEEAENEHKWSWYIS